MSMILMAPVNSVYLKKQFYLSCCRMPRNAVAIFDIQIWNVVGVVQLSPYKVEFSPYKVEKCPSPSDRMSSCSPVVGDQLINLSLHSPRHTTSDVTAEHINNSMLVWWHRSQFDFVSVNLSKQDQLPNNVFFHHHHHHHRVACPSVSGGCSIVRRFDSPKVYCIG